MAAKKPVKRKSSPRAKAGPKNTTCYFTQTKSTPDYKEVLVLKRFLSDRNKILHQSVTGCTAKNQRKLSEAIKRARYMALLPYTDRHAL